MTNAVEKNFICEEDLSLGTGTDNQSRGGQGYTLKKIRLAYIATATSELATLDYERYPQAMVFAANTCTFYKHDANASIGDYPSGIASAIAGVWLPQALSSQVAGLPFTWRVNHQATDPQVDTFLDIVTYTSKITSIVLWAPSAFSVANSYVTFELYVIEGGAETLKASVPMPKTFDPLAPYELALNIDVTDAMSGVILKAVPNVPPVGDLMINVLINGVYN